MKGFVKTTVEIADPLLREVRELVPARASHSGRSWGARFINSLLR
jgi:hypothetical protein